MVPLTIIVIMLTVYSLWRYIYITSRKLSICIDEINHLNQKIKKMDLEKREHFTKMFLTLNKRIENNEEEINNLKNEN